MSSEPENFEVASAQVLALASEVMQATSPEERRACAEALRTRVEALPGKFPGDKVQAVLRQLLDDDRLGETFDERGDPLRRTFVTANQQLGFPWAMELEPKDLQHVRMRPPRNSGGALAAGFALACALLAALEMGGFFLLSVVTSRGLGGLPPALFTFLCLVHALLAVSTLVRDTPARAAETRRRLKWLWRSIAVVPASAVVLTAMGDGNTAVFSICIAAPSILTAAFCGLTASEMAPGDAGPGSAKLPPS